MKKGSIILSVFLVAEHICLYLLGFIYPASIIGWYGSMRWGMLVYWIIHVTVIYTILNIYFLKSSVDYKYLFGVLLTYLAIRILYDFCIYKYLADKPDSCYLTMSKISFFSEILIQLFLLIILYISSYLKGYHFVCSKKSVFLLACILIICLAFIRLNLYITNIIIEVQKTYAENTILLESVLAAFSDNMIFEKLITLLTFLSVFWNLKKMAAVS